MPLFKDPSRKIFEAYLEKEISAKNWRSIKSQMKLSGMPLIPENLKIIAKCKQIAPRTPASGEVLNKLIQVYGELGVQASGEEIKVIVFRLNEKLNRDKFYHAFRVNGYPFTAKKCFQTKDIGHILYKLLSNKKVENQKDGKKSSC